MDDQYPGVFFSGGGRTDVIAANTGVPLGRRSTFISCDEPFIVLSNLLGQSVIRAQAFPDTDRGEPANRAFFCGLEESTPRDLTVHVTVKQVQELLRKIGRFLSLHGGGGWVALFT